MSMADIHFELPKKLCVPGSLKAAPST